MHSLHGTTEGDGGWLLRIRPSSRTGRLSAREHEIALHLAQGLGYREVAQCTGLAPATVRNHLRGIHAKLDIGNRAALVTAMRGRPARSNAAMLRSATPWAAGT